jgi:Tfp pilus assembly protein PilN
MTAPATEQLEAEGPVVSRVDWAPVPRVNLLPREILENRRFRRVQVLLAFAVVLTLALAGAAFWWSDRTVTEARDSLEVVEARTVALQKKQRDYAAVPQTLAELDYARTARETVMTNDVAWYRYLGDLGDAAPTDVYFDSLTLTVPGSGEGGAGGAVATPATESATADPFMPAGALGTVSIQGISGTYLKVATWLDALDKVTGLDVSTLDSANRTDGIDAPVTFSSGITVTDGALTHRYDRKAS